jgi:hypothetical protein
MIEVDDPAVVRLVRDHGRWHRNLGIRDVYKLLFQGVLGVAHLLEDRAKAWQWLVEEFEGLDLDQSVSEPLLERISVDGSVVRVKLRPFKRAGLCLESLFEVMVISAERIKADKDRFVALWKRFIALVKERRLDFDHEALMRFDAKVKGMDYPPVHHSRAYAKVNKPAYRVVHKKAYHEMFE